MKKLTFLFFAVLFSTLGIVACQEEENVKKAEIKLSKTEMTVPSKGGSFKMTYSIVNSTEGGEIAATSEAQWLDSIDCSAENIISFDVQVNKETEARETVIRLVYEPGSVSAEFTVKQEAAGKEDETETPFKISVTDIEIESAMAHVEALDQEMTYATMCIAKEQYEEFGSDEDMFKALVDRYWESASASGMMISDFLKKYVLKKGNQDLAISGLLPEIDYYVFAVGMNEKGEQLSSMVKAPFKTEEIEMNGATFDIDVHVDGPCVIAEVVPSDNDVYYYVGMLRKSDVDNMKGTLESTLKEYFDMQIAYGLQNNTPRETTMKGLLSQGQQLFDYKETYGDTDYMAVAVSVTLQGYINSEMSIKDFRTGSVPMSDNELTLDVREVGVDRVTLQINASNEDRYCMMVLPTSLWPGLSPEEYLEKMVGNPKLDQHVASGTRAGIIQHLTEQTEYYVLLFGYQNGVVTTDLVSKTFTTLEDGNPEELSFEVEFSEVGPNSLVANVVPTPNNALYFCNLVEASMSDNDVYAYIDEMAEMMISMGMVQSKADMLKGLSSRGNQSILFEGLYASTDYKLVAIGIYPATGTYATEILSSKVVRTQDRIISDAQITLISDKYFDGDEIAAAYPEYGAGRGMAVVPVEAKVSETAEKFYYHIFMQDVTDTKVHPDDALINTLVKQGGVTIPKTVFYCPFGKAMTMVAVAVDAEGNYGEVYRKAVNFKKSECAPSSEFQPLDQESVKVPFRVMRNQEILKANLNRVDRTERIPEFRYE